MQQARRGVYLGHYTKMHSFHNAAITLKANVGYRRYQEANTLTNEGALRSNRAIAPIYISACKQVIRVTSNGKERVKKNDHQ